jgi:hypothetical protein
MPAPFADRNLTDDTAHPNQEIRPIDKLWLIAPKPAKTA